MNTVARYLQANAQRGYSQNIPHTQDDNLSPALLQNEQGV